MQLEDLLKLHSGETYQPVYSQAKQLPEEAALLIKTTLDRFNVLRNNAHSEAVSMLAEKVRQVLLIEEPSRDDRRFLQTILKDYVVLTR